MLLHTEFVAEVNSTGDISYSEMPVILQPRTSRIRQLYDSVLGLCGQVTWNSGAYASYSNAWWSLNNYEHNVVMNLTSVFKNCRR